MSAQARSATGRQLLSFSFVMGRSAKFLKKARFHSIRAPFSLIYFPKVKKSTSGASQSTNKPTAVSVTAEQKKKAGLKAKAYKRKPGSEGHVLGGADYVGLMMGGRRRAREEAAKLPQDDN